MDLTRRKFLCGAGSILIAPTVFDFGLSAFFTRTIKAYPTNNTHYSWELLQKAVNRAKNGYTVKMMPGNSDYFSTWVFDSLSDNTIIINKNIIFTGVMRSGKHSTEIFHVERGSINKPLIEMRAPGLIKDLKICRI